MRWNRFLRSSKPPKLIRKHRGTLYLLLRTPSNSALRPRYQSLNFRRFPKLLALHRTLILFQRHWWKRLPGVKVQHTHSYCIEKDLKEFADIRLWNRSLAFGLTSVVLVAIIAIIAIVHYNSETYWGKQFYNVYSSPYLTKEEWKNISRDTHTIAILPDEFDKDSKRVKEQIKKSKATLKERKREAKKSSTR